MNCKNLQETLVCNNVTWEKAIVCLYSVKSHLKIITEFVYIAAVNDFIVCIMTKAIVWRQVNCSFSTYFSLTSICMIRCGTQLWMPANYWWGVANNGWKYKEEGTGSYAEKAE